MTTWIPDTCTLPTVDRPLRLAEWDALFRTAVTAVTRTGPASLTLALSSLDGVAELINRERECCSFLRFTTTNGTLVIEAPESCTELIRALTERVQGLVR